MIPAAEGATLPNVCTCAITSCRLFFSSFAASANCSSSRCYKPSDRKSQYRLRASSSYDVERTKFSFISAIASSEIGKPSSFSAMARFSNSFRHVWKRFCVGIMHSVSLGRRKLRASQILTAGEKRWAISLLAYRLCRCVGQECCGLQRWSWV